MYFPHSLTNATYPSLISNMTEDKLKKIDTKLCDSSTLPLAPQCVLGLILKVSLTIFIL